MMFCEFAIDIQKAEQRVPTEWRLAWREKRGVGEQGMSVLRRGRCPWLRQASWLMQLGGAPL